MVNRFILLLLLLIGKSTISAQPYEENSGDIFKDTITGEKVIKLWKQKGTEDIFAFYYSIKDTLACDMMFVGGYDFLVQHFDSVYYASFDDDYREVNKYLLCSILFDKQLKIKEIHILDAYSNPLFFKPYYKLIEKALLSTEGKWYRKRKYNRDKGSVFLFTKRISIVPKLVHLNK